MSFAASSVPRGPVPESDLIFSGPQCEGWPHHGHAFSIYPCPLSF